MVDLTFDDLVPAAQPDALQGREVNFDDLIPGNPPYGLSGGEVNFDDLIPGQPAYGAPGGELKFNDLIPDHPAYAPPGGEVSFDTLTQNEGASWPPSSPSVGAAYFGRTIGNPMTGQELQAGQAAWGGSISPDALPIGRTMAQYNAALDRSSEQRAYGADNGAVSYFSNPDGRPMIADEYVPGSDRPPISGESGAVGRPSLAPARPQPLQVQRPSASVHRAI